MKKTLCVFLLIFVVVVVFAANLNKNGISFSWDYNYLRPINYEEAVVVKNIDGDTIKVSIKGKEENVRLIGVDTPETVHPSKPVEEFGKEASDFTKAMCPVGSTVYLTYDWNPRDKYNRLLAYVWFRVGSTYVMQNLNIIANGYGNAYTTYSFKQEYMTFFRSAETHARNKGLGLWQGSSFPEKTETTNTIQTTPQTQTTNSGVNIVISDIDYSSNPEYIELKNMSSSSVNLSGWKALSVKGDQKHFLSGTLGVGQTLRIYSGPNAFGHIWTKKYIHNNKGDGVRLFDASGKLVDSKSW